MQAALLPYYYCKLKILCCDIFRQLDAKFINFNRKIIGQIEL